MIHLGNPGDVSGSEYFAKWTAVCVATQPPTPKKSSVTRILVCVALGAVAVLAVFSVGIIRKRRAQSGGGDGLGGLNQPILDEAIDGRDGMKSSW